MVNKLAYGFLAVLLLLGTLFYNPIRAEYPNSRTIQTKEHETFVLDYIIELNNAKTVQMSAEKGRIVWLEWLGGRDFERREEKSGEMMIGWGQSNIGYTPQDPADLYYNSDEDCYRDYVRIVGIDRGIVTGYMLYEIRCIDQNGTLCVEKIRDTVFVPLFGYMQLVPPGFVYHEIDQVIESRVGGGLFPKESLPEERPWIL